MENLIDEKFEAVAAAFTPWLAEQHPVEELEKVWYKTIGKYGRYKSHYFGEVIEKDAAISYLYVLECGSSALAVVLAFNGQGEVMTFILQPPEGEPLNSQPFWVVPEFPEPRYFDYRVPSYVDTTRFSETEFTMQGAIPIPAVMTVAKTNEPNPVVLIFQGFGATDRDETIGPLKPLRDIAWGLASQGIASVRFDCRAYTQPAEVVSGFDLNGYLLDDIAALLAYIRMESAIFDTTRIYLAAHGFGGMAAPIAAKYDGALAGLILLSTPARQFSDILVETVKNDMKDWDTTISEGEGKEKTLSEVAEILDNLQQRRLPPNEMILFAPAQVWYDLMDNNHLDIAGQLDIPVLIIHSGRDIKANDVDYEIWKNRFNGCQNVGFQRYDDLNHFYQPPGKGSAGKFTFQITGDPVNARVIEDLSVWIKSR
jgi:pimeloyl-ACP methyl ester carboxylesterase